MDEILKKIDEEIEKQRARTPNDARFGYCEGLKEAKNLILNNQGKLEHKAFKFEIERNYWEKEAKKYCAKLGEIQMLLEGKR